MISRRAILTLPAAVALPWSAHATDYPVRPIKFIVPVGPGSGTDLLGRYIARELGQAWKVPTVVENKTGGGGVIGTDAVAKAPGDGYTLLMTYASHYSNPWVIDKMPYDTIKDISPLATLASSVLIAIVAPDSPFKSMGDVYEEARRRPGKLSYGSAGVGTTGHVCGALMNSMANINVNHVPYKQTSQVALDAAAGVVTLSFSGVPTALPLIKSGRLARARRDQSEALVAPAGHADHGRNGAQGLRRHFADLGDGARGPARRRGAEALGRDAARRCQARVQGAVHLARAGGRPGGCGDLAGQGGGRAGEVEEAGGADGGQDELRSRLIMHNA